MRIMHVGGALAAAILLTILATSAFARPSSTQPFAVLKGHIDGVLALAFSRDGKLLASGGMDRTIRVWATASATLIKTFRGPKADIRALDFSPDGHALASASWDNQIIVWNVGTGEVEHIFQGRGGGLNTMAYAPDGRSIAYGGGRGEIELWDIATERCTAVLGPVSGEIDTPVDWIAFSHDGSLLLSTHDDATLRIWDVKTQELRGKFKMEGRAQCAGFMPDDKHALYGTWARALRVIDISTGQTTRQVHGLDGSDMALPTSDPRYALSMGGQKPAILNLEQGREVVSMSQHADLVRAIAISADNRWAASAGGGKYPTEQHTPKGDNDIRLYALTPELLANMTPAEREAERLRAALAAHPTDVPTAAKLVRHLAIELNQPEEAAKYLATANDETLSRAVPLMARKSDELNEADALALATWLGKEASTATAPAKPRALRTTIAAFDRYLALHKAEDNERKNALAGWNDASAALAKTTPGGEGVRVVDLLALVDPARDVKAGTWKREPGGGIVGNATTRPSADADPSAISEPTGARLSLPYKPPAEYDLRIEFTRQSGDSIALVFTDAGHRAAYVVAYSDNNISGFDTIAGKRPDTNPTRKAIRPTLENNVRSTLIVQVRTESIDAYLDGRYLGKHNTNGSDLSLNKAWMVPGGLGIVHPKGRTIYHVVELIEVKGKGVPAGNADH